MEKKFKLEVLDHDIDVEFSTTKDNWGLGLEDGASAAMGTCNIANNYIKINTGYHEGTWLSTFCHELAHLFVCRFSNNLEEPVIDMIGMGMHSFLKHNIGIVNELYNADLKYIAEERDQLKETVDKLIDEIEDLKDQFGVVEGSTISPINFDDIK